MQRFKGFPKKVPERTPKYDSAKGLPKIFWIYFMKELFSMVARVNKRVIRPISYL